MRSWSEAGPRVPLHNADRVVADLNVLRQPAPGTLAPPVKQRPDQNEPAAGLDGDSRECHVAVSRYLCGRPGAAAIMRTSGRWGSGSSRRTRPA